MTIPQSPFKKTSFWNNVKQFVVLQKPATTDQIIEALRDTVLEMNDKDKKTHRYACLCFMTAETEENKLWVGTRSGQRGANLLLLANAEPLKKGHTYPKGTKFAFVQGAWKRYPIGEGSNAPEDTEDAIRNLFTSNLEM